MRNYNLYKSDPKQTDMQVDIYIANVQKINRHFARNVQEQGIGHEQLGRFGFSHLINVCFSVLSVFKFGSNRFL